MKLSQRIETTRLERGELALFYLAQAGFLFKTGTNTTVCLDAYLGDSCERLFGFKRMVPLPLSVKEMRADLLVATHSHADHLDVDLLDHVKKTSGIRFIGSPDCRPVYRAAGIADERVTILAAGESARVGDVALRAVYADHGKLAPDAMGLLIGLGDVTVYDTGDTAYCPEKILASLGKVTIDILIVPINPAFGNLGHENAVRLTELIRPRIVIGSHFGMFIEHGGDPSAFLDCAKRTLPDTITPLVMAPGERLIYSSRKGIVSLETQSSQ